MAGGGCRAWLESDSRSEAVLEVWWAAELTSTEQWLDEATLRGLDAADRLRFGKTLEGRRWTLDAWLLKWRAGRAGDCATAKVSS